MRSTRMHRGAMVAAAALLTTTFAVAAPASADDEPNPVPATSKYVCEALYGGVYQHHGLVDQGDGTASLDQTCTVVDDQPYSEMRPGANPNSGFMLDVEVSESTIVYTNTTDWVRNASDTGWIQVNRTTTEDVTEEVTINACYNSAGNLVQGGNNPNCILP